MSNNNNNNNKKLPALEGKGMGFPKPQYTNAAGGYNSSNSQLPASFGGQGLARGTNNPNAGSWSGNAEAADDISKWKKDQKKAGGK